MTNDKEIRTDSLRVLMHIRSDYGLSSADALLLSFTPEEIAVLRDARNLAAANPWCESVTVALPINRQAVFLDDDYAAPINEAEKELRDVSSRMFDTGAVAIDGRIVTNPKVVSLREREVFGTLAVDKNGSVEYIGSFDNSRVDGAIDPSILFPEEYPSIA